LHGPARLGLRCRAIRHVDVDQCDIPGQALGQDLACESAGEVPGRAQSRSRCQCSCTACCQAPVPG
jgi:hypothetical protein